MSFDQSVVLWCIVLPTAIAAVVFFLGRSLATNENENENSRDKLNASILAFGCWLAIWLALSARQEWQLWPSEFWHWPALALFLWALTPTFIQLSNDKAWKWMIVLAIASATSLSCLPTGEGWEDTFDAHGRWGIVLTLAMTLNTWAIEDMAGRNTQRWVLLVVLASLGGPIALAASSYASLTEWSIAIATATGVITILTLICGHQTAWSFGPMASAAGLCVLAAGRFQTFEEHPAWLYVSLLFLPTIISLVDGLLSKKPMAIRVSTAALLAIALVGTSIWFFLIQETESW